MDNDAEAEEHKEEEDEVQKFPTLLVSLDKMTTLPWDCCGSLCRDLRGHTPPTEQDKTAVAKLFHERGYQIDVEFSAEWAHEWYLIHVHRSEYDDCTYRYYYSGTVILFHRFSHQKADEWSYEMESSDFHQVGVPVRFAPWLHTCFHVPVLFIATDSVLWDCNDFRPSSGYLVLLSIDRARDALHYMGKYCPCLPQSLTLLLMDYLWEPICWQPTLTL